MIADFGLGSVTVPSGVLVLGLASWIGHWPRLGENLSWRAAPVAGSKSLAWRARARVGGRVRWYERPEDVWY